MKNNFIKKLENILSIIEEEKELLNLEETVNTVNEIYKTALTKFQLAKIKNDSNADGSFSAFFSKKYAETSYIVKLVDDIFQKLVNKNLEEVRKLFGNKIIEKFTNKNALNKETLKEVLNLEKLEQKLISEYFIHASKDEKSHFTLQNTEPYFLEEEKREKIKEALNLNEKKEVFLKLIAVRNQIAELKGFKNFFEAQMHFQERNMLEIDSFLVQTGKCIPIKVKEVKKIQKKFLRNFHSKQRFIFFKGKLDKSFTFKSNVENVLAKIDNDLKLMFEEMDATECLNISNSKNKKDIAYTTFIYNKKMPYVFMKNRSSFYDLRTLTHEIGHAFEKYINKDLKYFFDFNDNIEIAESQAITMEFIYARALDNQIQTEKAKEYYIYILLKNLLLIQDALCIFEFEKLSYAKKIDSVAQLNILWEEICLKYGFENDEIEDWASKKHIYNAPCYYINYATAKLLALQFLERFINKPENAILELKEYIKFGSKLSKEKLYEKFNLNIPLSANAIENLNTNFDRVIKDFKNLKFNTNI